MTLSSVAAAAPRHVIHSRVDRRRKNARRQSIPLQSSFGLSALGWDRIGWDSLREAGSAAGIWVFTISLLGTARMPFSTEAKAGPVRTCEARQLRLARSLPDPRSIGAPR